LALAAVGVWGAEPAWAQRLFRSSRPAAAGDARPAQDQPPPAQPAAQDAPQLKVTAIPVNPTDPIALINGEVITRRQLADECVARKGEEILDTLIARKLIEQALKARKLDVSRAEIDEEIDQIARKMAGIGREAWLRTLDKERGISPVQYARDIIYPALALRKLAAPRVQVTANDLKQAFEAQFAEKIRCRLIMVDTVRKAQEIWEELKKNPAVFEKLAQDRSMDSGSRSLGGLLAEPISRHAYPQNVSDAAFRQLVDGLDPKDKPKDGDFTGPIQVAAATWVILKREGLIPAQHVDSKDPQVRQQVYNMIYEVKLKEAMGEYFNELTRAAAIDNKLSGRVKLANEELHPASQRVDGEVKLMGGSPPPVRSRGASPTASAAAIAAGSKLPPPSSVPQDLIKETETLTKRSLKPRTAPATNSSGAPGTAP
jgi:foldase protein PrsA